MKNKITMFLIMLSALLLVGCGQVFKSDIDDATSSIDSGSQQVGYNEAVIARTNMKMNLQNNGGGISVLSIEEVASIDYNVDVFVPDFMKFYVTGNITFNVTESGWITANGYLAYEIDYNKLSEEDLERVYVRAYLQGSDGLVGVSNPSEVADLQVKVFNEYDYAYLTDTPLEINGWDAPFDEAIDHVQAMKFRADFTGLSLQRYTGTIIFEVVRVVEGAVPPTNFNAAASYGRNNLSWINPDFYNFSHVQVRRSTSNYPLTFNDGEYVYSGTNQSYRDETVIADVTYNYSIFATDKKGNWSEPATASAKARHSTVLLLHMDGVSNNFIDSSSSSHPVMAYGGVTQVPTAGLFDGASYFDGIDDYLVVDESNSDFDFGYSNSFAYQFAVKFSDVTDNVTLLSTDGYYNGLRVYYSNNKLYCTALSSGLSGDWVPSPNSWYFISVIGQHLVSNHVRIGLYVDGVLLDSKNYENFSWNFGDLYIGRKTDSDQGLFHGFIDEVRVLKYKILPTIFPSEPF